MQPYLQVDGLSFRYKGQGFQIRDLSFSLAKGDMLSLVGPSGCGKSSVLKLLAGFLRPNSGEVRVAGQDVTYLQPEKRQMGLVFQNYALFPHLTVLNNLEFGLRIRGGKRKDHRQNALAMLDRIGLNQRFADKMPHELSGGQQQRVALGRALILEPKVLFLDEPLANLDRRLRETMRSEILRLCRDQKVTTILVTHDQEEALSMGDYVAVMKEGLIEQWDVPEQCYMKPRTLFVSEFLGDINTFDVRVSNGTVHWLDIPYVASWADLPGMAVAGARIAAIRPESITLGHADTEGLFARIEHTTFLGNCVEVIAVIGEKRIKVKCTHRPESDKVTVHFDAHRWLFFA